MKAIDRLFQYLEYKDIKHTRFEKDSGLSNGYLTTQKRRNGDLGESVLNSIVNNCQDIDPAWLLTGSGKMIKENQRSNEVSEPTQSYTLRTDRNIETQMIPLYNIEATAGVVPLFDGSNKQKPIDFLSIPNLPKCDGAVFVTGDSMYPLLKSGDIVIYKSISDYWQNVYWGEMYIVSLDMEGDEYVAVKYVQKSEMSTENIRLVSYNKHHQDKEVPLNKVRAMALVKASVRMNIMS